MNQTALELLLPELRAIPTRNVLRPQEKGISHFLQQTENLCFWYRPHREALVGPGLSAEMLDELPLRLAACRKAQAQWIAAMQNKTPKQQKLDDIEGKAQKLLKELKRRLRHLGLIEGKPETGFYPNLNPSFAVESRCPAPCRACRGERSRGGQQNA
jgi:hypothetical protein